MHDEKGFRRASYPNHSEKPSVLLKGGIVAVVIAAFAITLLLYPALPDPMDTHWNSEGNVDGYLPRAMGAFIIPFVMLCTMALFMLIPRIDPLGGNIELFRRYYEGFILLFGTILLTIQLFVLLWNSGVRTNPNGIVPFCIGILIVYTGYLLGKARRNWFIGIRTRWTMSSDRVWERTHRLGRTLFVFAGAISMLGVLFQEYAWLFVLIPLLAVSIATVVYSFIEFRREIVERQART